MEPSAFFASVGGKQMHPDTARTLYGTSVELEHCWDFGWIPPEIRSAEQRANDAVILASMPTFQIRGSWQMDERRYQLWNAYKKLTGKFLPYNWQLTGSCVGAGGGNMAKTLMSIQAVLGTMEYRELFWPFTYGKSRERDGSRSPGEGSTGTSYSEAATEDGYISFDEDASVVGSPTFNQGWLQLTSGIEMKWSNGLAAPSHEVQIGKTHLIKAKAPMRSSADVLAAFVNYYPVTQASNFGMRNMVPSVQGTPGVRLGSWDGSWSHQTYLDEVWDHPTLGLIFRWGNNWGPEAHGSPTGDEPSGGVYLKASTVDQICANGEVFAFSGDISGFPARKIDFGNL